MKTTDMAPYYVKTSSTSDFYVWDGLNIALPSTYQGRFLQIGVYDLTKEPKFKSVKACSTTPLTVEAIDVQTLNATEYGALVIDGYAVQLNDRVMLNGQEDATQNGIYIATSIGSEAEYFTLKRASDANNTATFVGGNFVFVTEGNTLANNLFQLVPYDTFATFGSTPFTFLNLSAEGYYSNQSFALRLINSIMCNQLEMSNSSIFSFANPDFIHTPSKRLIGALVPYTVSIDSVMNSILKSQVVLSMNNSAETPCTCVAL